MPARKKSRSTAAAAASESPKKPRMTTSPPEKTKSTARMSQCVTYNNTVYLAGQVPDDCSADIKGQTQDVLDKIDKLLEEVHCDKSKIISATIYLKDITKDFGPMNEVWEAWVPSKYPPARATVQAEMARGDILVEIVIIAALCKDYPEEEEEQEDGEEAED